MGFFRRIDGDIQAGLHGILLKQTARPDRAAWTELSKMTIDFHGAKIALLIGEERLPACQRDDKTGIPFPGRWDLPGGGREGAETPVECVLREVDEEFGLSLALEVVHWMRAFPSERRPGAASYFMVGALTPAQCAAIRFGQERQQWALMTVEAFLNHAHAVPHLQRRLRDHIEHPRGRR